MVVVTYFKPCLIVDFVSTQISGNLEGYTTNFVYLNALMIRLLMVEVDSLSPSVPPPCGPLLFAFPRPSELFSFFLCLLEIEESIWREEGIKVGGGREK